MIENMQRQRVRQSADHPDEAIVLLLLDGELSSRETKSVGMHLQRCRDCQAKMKRLRTGIYAFVEYTQEAFLPAVGAPPKGWSEFPALLEAALSRGLLSSDSTWSHLEEGDSEQ